MWLLHLSLSRSVVVNLKYSASSGGRTMQGSNVALPFDLNLVHVEIKRDRMRD